MWESLSEKVEKTLEVLIFASRWILAPFYLGLAISLVVLLMWMYFSFAILLLGASVAKALAIAKAPAESGDVLSA